MNIGDRVRVLHGTEEGIITKIIDGKTVEIEVTEGFTFPVLISDLVKINDQEERFFTEEKTIETKVQAKEVQANKGIFVALEHLEEANKYRLHLINNSDLDIVCAIFRKEGKLRYSGFFRGLINKRTSNLISNFNISNLSLYNELYCQILFFDNGPSPLRSPVERQIRIAAMLASEKSVQTPVIEVPSWLKQIDDQELSRENVNKQDSSTNIPVSQIDLHAEALGINEKGLAPNEILETQIKAFNESLDKAIMHGLPEITFIHGLGQGTLKNRIIKEIKNHTGIKYWEEAQKEKFGHGAIKIVL